MAVQARWTEYPERAGGFAVDLDRARLVTARLRELQSALGLAGDVTLELVARQPDVLARRRSEAAVEVPWTEVEPIVAQAAAECRAMRAREGEALAAELRHRLDAAGAGGRRSSRARAPERLMRERDRLRGAVAELLDGRHGGRDPAGAGDRVPGRPARHHRGAGAVPGPRRRGAGGARGRRGRSGKQLGFLAQELGREVNTMGSKANDAEIAQQVIAMKGELEKFREQLENLE